MSTDNKENINIVIHPEDRKLDNVELPEYKAEKKDIKTAWTPEIEDYVGKIGETSLKYKKLHSSKSKNYMYKYNLLMYVSIFLGPLVGMLSAININLNDTRVIPIIILCISFFNGILISVIKFRRWDEGSLLHKASAAKYAALSSNAKRQLTLKSKDRDDSDDYLKWMTNAFNSLFLSSPMINEEAEKDFENLSMIKQKQNITGEIVLEELDGKMKYELKRFLNSD